MTFDAKTMFDYDAVKDRLFIKVEKKGLDSVRPYSEFLDWIVTYHILIDDEDESVTSIRITESILKMFNVSLERLHDDAVKNSQKLFPAYCDSIRNTICEMEGMSAEPEYMDPDGPKMLVITNMKKAFGASAILYPGMMKDIEERLGDFYVLPSSIHEVIAVPALSSDAAFLADIVRSVNDTQVAPNEQLSDHVYRYRQETAKLEIAA